MNFIQLKFLEPENATIQEVCPKTRPKMTLRELCPVDDRSRDGFNQMNTNNSERFQTVLTKMTKLNFT